MAITSQELAIVLTAKDSASAVLAGAATQTGASTQKMGAHFSGLGLAAKAAAGLITGTLVGALADMARAAAADAASVASLQQAVENSGASWDENLALIEARISAGQRLAFADDQTRASLQILTEATGSVTTALGVQSLAMDISRARHISLEAASTLVGKVVSGNVTVLKKFGVTLAEGATAAEALAALQSKFGGQAETYGKTTSAAIDRIKDSIGEWQESIGAALGPAQTFLAVLPGLSVGMSAFGGILTSMGIPGLGGLKAALLGVLPAAGGMFAAMLPIILVVGAIAAAVLLAKTAWERNWGDIRGTVRAAQYAITAVLGKLGEALGWVGDRAGDAADAFGRAFGWIMDRARDLFNMLPGFIRDRLGEWDFLGMRAIGNFARGMVRETPRLLNEVAGLVDDLGELAGNVIPALGEVGGDMIASLGAGMNSMQSWLGTQLAGVGGMIPANLIAGAGDIEGIGLSIPTDLAAGITKGAGAAKSAAEALGADVASAFKALAATMLAEATEKVRGIGAAITPAATAGQQVAIGTSQLVKATTGGAGLISAAQAVAGPKNIFMGIPMFQGGGVMPWTGLAHLERGEVVSRSAVTINFNGPIYGMLDFEQTVKRIIRDAFPRAVTA